MCSAETINQAQARKLLELAHTSIERGLSGHPGPELNQSEFSGPLSQPGACFVTLTLGGELRGCIGHLEASQSLLEDVVENARLAAFDDPRFPPLTPREYPLIELSISILGQPEPLFFSSEEDLLDQLRPGVDGLILKHGRHRGTFLPAVWESLPQARNFLSQLKRKAGLQEDYWSDEIEIYRYTTQQIKEDS